MSTLCLLTTVVRRNKLSDLLNYYESSSIELNTVTLGRGTVRRDEGAGISLSGAEKAVVLSFVTQEQWPGLKKGLYRKLLFDVPDTGIAFLSPLSSVGGKRQLEYLTDGLDFKKEEESILKNTEVELIIAICNQGYNEQVMEAARREGARGGTVIRGQGTGIEKAEKFLGITLAAEKDVIYIVSPKDQKNAIMESIMRYAGLETGAGAICFSLPVTDTAGIHFAE